MGGDLARRVVLALDDLTTTTADAPIDLIAAKEHLVWVSPRASALFGHKRLVEVAADDGLTGLVAAARLTEHEDRVRLGWIWLVGQARDLTGRTGRVREVLMPLVSMPVRLEAPKWGPLFERTRVRPAGEIDWNPLLSPAAFGPNEPIPTAGDLSWADLLPGDGSTPTPGDQPFMDLAAPEILAWVNRVVAALGLPNGTPVRTGPPIGAGNPREVGRLTVRVAPAIYIADEQPPARARQRIGGWAHVPGLEHTAFAALYLGSGASVPAEPADGPGDGPHPAPDPPAGILSPFPLNAGQRELVARARVERLTVISGPPGSGKTHTLAAMALDAIADGQRVLIATGSNAAAESIAEMLGRTGGPEPVMFGVGARRWDLIDRLADGLGDAVHPAEVEAAWQRATSDSARCEALHVAIAAIIGRVASAEHGDVAATLACRELTPALFDASADLDLADESLAELTDGGRGWRERRRDGRAADQLQHLTAATAPLDPVMLADCIRAARAARDRAALDSGAASGEPGALWSQLDDADRMARHCAGEFLAADARSRRRRTGPARAAALGLATALRAERDARRERIAGLDHVALTNALPLWVGTVRDIDDLLPRVSGLFDLVILDEASQIDQPAAAGAMLRGRRAVIAGDPRQLRHETTVTDRDVASALARQQLGMIPEIAAKLDVLRQSSFDVAAGSAPVTVLTEHYRSLPHLIAFASERFYGRRLTLARRHPANESTDCIELITVQSSEPANVNAPEVEASVVAVRRLMDEGFRSIGVMAPFREQASAIRTAMLDAFTPDEIEAHGLRGGTVRSFQGAERDAVVLSTTVRPTDSARRRSVLADPGLFNVAITRARSRQVVVTSLPLDTHGLVGDYLRQCDQPPGRPAPRASAADPWILAIAEAFDRAGHRVTRHYPAGRHTIDVVVGEGATAIGIVCRVHDGGAEAHIERHLELERLGWRLAECYEPVWSSRLATFVVSLGAELRS